MSDSNQQMMLELSESCRELEADLCRCSIVGGSGGRGRGDPLSRLVSPVISSFLLVIIIGNRLQYVRIV